MIFYSEEKVGNRSIYIKTVTDEKGNISVQRKVSIPLFQIEQEGYIYFILYNDYMMVYTEAYEYLNYSLREKPLTSRCNAAHALRILYSFLSLSSILIHQMSEIEVKELVHFLRGISSNPEQYSMKTQRSSNTVNGYLSVYRSFFTANNIECDALFRSHFVNENNIYKGDQIPPNTKLRYDNNLRASSPVFDTVPKYVGPNEFKMIYKLAIEKNDVQAQILMHLMYGYGLRLGECLGLTLEDIQEIKDNNQLVPVLYLRNRITDKRYQFAKGLMHVVNANQYRSRDYQQSRWKIILTYDFYDKLIEYIERTHSAALEKYPDNYATGIADIVSQCNKPDTNHYVFLNRFGRILSDQTWNNKLKLYFAEANIPIDHDVRDNNLSHRFRHGFAMFHARFSPHPVDALILGKLMRHKSISSTMVYYNPTPEDEYNIKTDFQYELYNMIPELKEGMNVT